MTEPTDRDREMYLAARALAREDMRRLGVNPWRHLGDYDAPHIILAIATAREEGRREAMYRIAKSDTVAETPMSDDTNQANPPDRT